MEKKFSDEKAVELIFESLQKLKRGELSFEAFAVGVAMVVDPVPLNSSDMRWAFQTGKALGYAAVEHTLAGGLAITCGVCGEPSEGGRVVCLSCANPPAAKA